MDNVTHAMMGTIVASPFLASAPEAAAAFMFGSVLPDLDAFSRVFGRRAFLKSHQTYSHAYPVIVAIGLIALAAREVGGVTAPWAPLALALGMAFHTTLDWTNTYGITTLAPFSRKRSCREWVFFIDSVVVTASVAVLVVLGLRIQAGEALGWKLQAGYGVVMVVYWLLKIGLRRRCPGRCPEGTLSLLPSALVPWHYLGCAREGTAVTVFRVNGFSGQISDEETIAVLDADHLEVLEGLPEFRAMRELTPAYHLVSSKAEGERTKLVCRDLRTRNFKTRFGQLDLELTPAGTVENLVFHV